MCRRKSWTLPPYFSLDAQDKQVYPLHSEDYKGSMSTKGWKSWVGMYVAASKMAQKTRWGKQSLSQLWKCMLLEQGSMSPGVQEGQVVWNVFFMAPWSHHTVPTNKASLKSELATFDLNMVLLICVNVTILLKQHGQNMEKFLLAHFKLPGVLHRVQLFSRGKFKSIT